MNAPFRSPIGCSIPNVRDQALTQGYARIRASEFMLTDYLKAAFQNLVCRAGFLPLDKTSKGANRRRGHRSFTMIPWTGSVHWNQVVWNPKTNSSDSQYSQPSSLNPEDGGRERWFWAITGQTIENPYLEAQIWFDFQNSPLSDEERSCVFHGNIHLVELEARPDKPAVASPNVVHRDGEPVTWVHLLRREKVSGGENWITDPCFAGRRIADVPPSGVREGFVLEKPLEAYVVRDDLVAHSVEAVHVAPGATVGRRTVLIIDFTPMKPQITL